MRDVPIRSMLLSAAMKCVGTIAHRSRDIPAGFRYHVSIGGWSSRSRKLSDRLIIGAPKRSHHRVSDRRGPDRCSVDSYGCVRIVRGAVFRPVPGLELVGVVKTRFHAPRREFEGFVWQVSTFEACLYGLFIDARPRANLGIRTLPTAARPRRRPSCSEMGGKFEFESATHSWSVAARPGGSEGGLAMRRRRGADGAIVELRDRGDLRACAQVLCRVWRAPDPCLGPS